MNKKTISGIIILSITGGLTIAPSASAQCDPNAICVNNNTDMWCTIGIQNWDISCFDLSQSPQAVYPAGKSPNSITFGSSSKPLKCSTYIMSGVEPLITVKKGDTVNLTTPGCTGQVQ